ncbi:MAG: DUF5683 domain-containing protein [Ignavibacteriales bacterium]|nr:DUF5683 domain-containing protein [Ignavibacteriales bacterium]
MNKLLILITLFFTFYENIFPQVRPNWIQNPPLQSSGYGTFYYKVASAEDIDAASARISAIATALYEGALKIGLFVNLDEIKSAIKKKGIPGASVDIKLPINIVCDYTESLFTKRGYKVWVLCQVAERGNIDPNFENFNDCYPTTLITGFNALWRSIVVPGWGQLYKNDSFKGISFMVGSIGGLAGGLILKQLSIDATNKALSARTQAVRDFYNNESKNYDTYSKISLITAAALYIWNVIDAVAVKQDNLHVGLDSNQNLQICYRYNF